jgi:3-deoxy-7-phosphoheptulonate synthase
VDALRNLEGVDRLEPCPDRPVLTERGERTGTTPVRCGEATFGEGLTVAAGPCAVEDRSRILDLAHAAKEAGADVLRGGAFKPRTSPYSFRGSGLRGLAWLREAAEAAGLPAVTEALDTRDVAVVADHADMIQIGSRNMMNYALLSEAGRAGKPVLLKRGMGATLPELYYAAEYLLLEGAPGVVLCERGIRTLNTTLRNTLDLSAVPLIREETHLPVIVDPSHATGRRSLVPPMALAAAAAGACGVIVEIHDDPAAALSDGEQAIYPETLRPLIDRMRRVAAIAEEGRPTTEES